VTLDCIRRKKLVLKDPLITPIGGGFCILSDEIAGLIGGRGPIAKGFEIAGFGAAVFLVSYAMGRFIPPLFGMAPVSAGG